MAIRPSSIARGSTGVRLAGLCILALALASCAVVPATPAITPDRPLLALADGAEACELGPDSTGSRTALALEPESIELLNWNIQKGRVADWNTELYRLGRSADLLTLQEVPLANSGWEDHAAEDFHAFAPGFRSNKTQTGVMTVSAAVPLVQCNLSAREPWLRTAKATIVTQYALNGRDDTLLVVNIHAVNFSLGLVAFERQLEQAVSIVSRHDGPVIFSGDFNTWRQGRLDTVDTLARDHGLIPVDFGQDARKRVFGQPLDHVFIRGLQIRGAASHPTSSSDHAPMQVWLSAI